MNKDFFHTNINICIIHFLNIFLEYLGILFLLIYFYYKFELSFEKMKKVSLKHHRFAEYLNLISTHFIENKVITSFLLSSFY